MRFRALALAAGLVTGTSIGCGASTDEAHMGPPAGVVGGLTQDEIDAGTAPRELVVAAAARLRAVLAGEAPPEPEPVFEGYPIGEAFGALVPDQTA
jgi:hypothetical protein